MRWCAFRSPFWLKVLLHSPHVYGRSPLCMRWCVFRWPFWLKDLLQISQVYGRSPLCMRWCVFKKHFRLNDFLHTPQTYDCSPGCMSTCAFILHLHLNDSLYPSQAHTWPAPSTSWFSLSILCKKECSKNIQIGYESKVHLSHNFYVNRIFCLKTHQK